MTLAAVRFSLLVPSQTPPVLRERRQSGSAGLGVGPQGATTLRSASSAISTAQRQNSWSASAARARRLSGDAGRTIARAADSLNARLTAVEEAIYQTKNRSSQDPLNYPIRLNNKLAALTDVVGDADARPTEQARQVFAELSAALQVELDRLQVALDTGVPAFNALVKQQDVPAIILR